MTKSVEIHQEIVDPAYWNGVDIFNPAHFTDDSKDTPYKSISLSPSEKYCAWSGMIRFLHELYKTRGVNLDETKLEKDTFDPMDEDCQVGSFVILEREHIYRETSSDPNRYFMSGPRSDPIPISPSYINYWLINQGKENFIPETVFSTTDRIEYTRELCWGAIIAQARKRRGLDKAVRLIQPYDMNRTKIVKNLPEIPSLKYSKPPFVPPISVGIPFNLTAEEMPLFGETRYSMERITSITKVERI